MPAKNDHINYVEFKAPDLERIKTIHNELAVWSEE